MGKDRIGAYYANQSMGLAKELVYHVKKGLKKGMLSYEDRDFQRSYRLAVRAAFMIHT